MGKVRVHVIQISLCVREQPKAIRSCQGVPITCSRTGVGKLANPAMNPKCIPMAGPPKVWPTALPCSKSASAHALSI
eukprot:1136537-Pelagomonas_calceolata.AAC.7